MVNLASTPSEQSPYLHTEMLRDELVAGLALVNGLHQLRPKKLVEARWKMLMILDTMDGSKWSQEINKGV